EPEPLLVLVEETPTVESEAEPLLEVLEEESPASPSAPRRFSILGMLLLVVVVFGCSIYANLSFLVKNRVKYQYFPPFKKYYNANDNKHLGAEYFNIAKSMAAGEGFASPFNNEKTGPTAWMPPLLPTLLAALLWICDGDVDAVMAIVIFLQVYTLAG